jgi:hypothetical protein
MPQIKILPSTEIDFLKWDNCVAQSTNGLIYAYSFYLNAMAKHWYGLIVNDYEAIFPIPVKKKLSIQYAYMPAFTQQLGLIGNEKMNTKILIDAMQSFLKYGSIHLNFSNINFTEKISEKNNFILELKSNYSVIKEKYKKTIAYSLSKAAKQHFIYTKDDDIEKAVALYKLYNQKNMPHVIGTDYSNFKKLLLLLQKNNKVLVRKVETEKQELMSIALLLKDNKRYYNILNTTTEAGRKTEANYFLYDNILQELSNQNRLFDFEGSDLHGVQKFYEKFGAINQPYFYWHYNVLPKPLQWLKK